MRGGMGGMFSAFTTLRARTRENSYGEESGWSNEAIADYCGFSDRSYFQKKFKESTGMTPTDYLASISKK